MRELPMNQPFDRDAVLNRFERDTDLVRDMVRLFQESSAGWMTDLRAALAAGDLTQASRLAHTLKGSVGNFLAHDAAVAAKRLESASRAGNAAASQEALGPLEQEIGRLQKALEGLVTT